MTNTELKLAAQKLALLDATKLSLILDLESKINNSTDESVTKYLNGILQMVEKSYTGYDLIK